MTSGADPNVMSKVRKLLNLGAEGSGGTEAERDLAMERAQHLMLKYNLDLAVLDTHGENAEKKGDVEQHKGMETNRRSDWEGRLLSTVAYYNLCKTYYISDGARGGGKQKTWFVVGRPHNVAFVQELHQFCIDQLKAECKRALGQARGTPAARNPNSFRRAFFEGAQLAIGSRLAQQQRARIDDTGSKGQELVRSETADIQAYLNEMFPGMKETRHKGRSGNVAGRNAGAEAGRRADLFPGRKLGS